MISFYCASVLALGYIGLALNVIRLRNQYRVSLADGGEPSLKRAIRAHANFNEYVPLAVILLFMAEQLVGAAALLILSALCLILGRLSHAYGILQLKEPLKFRVLGMVMTLVSMLISICVGTLNYLI